MQKLPMKFNGGHLYASFGENDWLIDTGSPVSFGSSSALAIAGQTFDIANQYSGLTAEALSELAGHATAGAIGADVLNSFDVLFDLPNSSVTFSAESIEMSGAVVEADEFMGVPIIEVTIAGAAKRMFFDTGAQVSYIQDESLYGFPAAGVVTDFFPGFGQFQTETYLIGLQVAGRAHSLRCGTLPPLLGMALTLAGAVGIIGNEIMRDHAVGCFPRRGRLVFA